MTNGLSVGLHGISRRSVGNAFDKFAFNMRSLPYKAQVGHLFAKLVVTPHYLLLLPGFVKEQIDSFAR